MNINYQNLLPSVSPDQLSGGAITGFVFGVLVGLALILAVVVVVHRRWSVWRQMSILRGGASSNAAFDNILYRQDQEDTKAVDFS